MIQVHWMVSLVRVITILFVLIGCYVLFLYSPFYSQLAVKGLNHFVPVEVDELAALSQKPAALSENENLEPGSNLWIARQAYLKLMENNAVADNAAQFALIQARYKILQQLILDQNEQDKTELQTPKPMAQLAQEQTQTDVASSEVAAASTPLEFLESTSVEQQALMAKYIVFLESYPLQLPTESVESTTANTDVIEPKKNNAVPSVTATQSQPYAIVVLGGGLTLGANGKDIVVNNYTRLRLEKTLQVEQKYHLPIVLSGVEAPYMQAWLAERGIEAKLLENRSMNTCENSRFSSLLLQKKGGAPRVILITDEYHMPRTRRLFALNGIETMPVIAPMPTSLTEWRPSQQNYDHSRRANYEMLATMRDMLFGSSDCREVP